MTDPVYDRTPYIITNPNGALILCYGRKEVEETAGKMIATGPAVDIYRLAPVRFETETRTHVRILPERPKDDVAKAT